MRADESSRIILDFAFDWCRDSRPRLSGGAKLRSCRRRTTGRGQRIRTRNGLSPQPRILPPFAHQPSPYGIVDNILHLRVEILRSTQHVIKRFRLPDFSSAPKKPIDAMCRRSFDRIRDRRKGTNFDCLTVDRRRKDQMHVIGHDDGNFQIELSTIVMQAGVQDGVTNSFGQDPPLMRAESNVMWFVIDLKMRKLTPIKSLRHATPM
jgi:hypothetical protein